MKKKKILWLFLILCAFVYGCSNFSVAEEPESKNPAVKNEIAEGLDEEELAVENHIFLSEPENGDNKYIWKLLDMDKKYIDDILCLKGGNIIYCHYEQDGMALGFYKYSINQNKTCQIGEIKNPYIDSGDIAVVGDKIFFYSNRLVTDFQNPDGKVESSLYQIDIKNNKLEKIASDFVKQTLIYVDAMENKIISFKGKMNGNKGISYLDTISVSDGDTAGFELFLQKKYNNKKKTGEVIYHFAEYDSVVYVLVLQKKSSDKSSWVIEKYDCDGSYLGSIKLNKKIKKLIDGERISKFEIFGEYGFLRNFSGGGIVFQISGKKTEPKLWKGKYEDLDIAISPDRNRSYVIFYCRDTAEAWKLDIADDIWYPLELGYDYLNYIFVDNDKILISSDETVYGEVAGQFLGKN